MPYIESKSDRREKLRNGEPALTAGELNYQIFWHTKHYSEFKGNATLESFVKLFVHNFLGKSPNYQKYNDVTGALIRCYIEIKRRLGKDVDILLDIAGSYNDEIAKYEDKKIIENGDVE